MNRDGGGGIKIKSSPMKQVEQRTGKNRRTCTTPKAGRRDEGEHVGCKNRNKFLIQAEKVKREDIIVLCTQISKLDFPSASISARECGRLIAILAERLQKEDHFGGQYNFSDDEDDEEENKDQCTTTGLNQNLVQLLTLLNNKKHIEFGAPELSATVKFLLDQISKTLEKSIPDCSAAVQALSSVLFSCGPRCGHLQVQLGSVLVDQVLANSSDIDLALKSDAFVCVGNLVQRKLVDKSRADTIISQSVEALEGYAETSIECENDLVKLKIVNSSIRILMGTALAFGPGTLTSRVERLVLHLKNIVTRGLKSSQDGRALKQELHLKKSFTDDTSRRSLTNRTIKQLDKVRISALDLLQALCRVEVKPMQNQWDRLLPQRNGCRENPRIFTLATVFLYDPQVRVRSAAAATINVLLLQSPLRVWLSQRRPRAGKTHSFVSLGVKVARMIEQLHQCLGFAISREQNPSVVNSLLVCSASLIRSVPYEVQESESAWIGALFRNYEGGDGTEKGRSILDLALVLSSPGSKDYCENAVACLVALLETKDSALASVRALVLDRIGPALLQIKHDNEREILVLLQLGGALFRWYARLAVNELNLWPSLRSGLLAGFASTNENHRIAAIQAVQHVISGGAEHGELNLEGLDTIISIDVPRALQDQDAGVCTAAASCIADVRPDTWHLVPEARRLDCLRKIVDASISDNSLEVRLSALTALSLMVLLPTCKKSSHVDACAPALLKSLQDDETAIRARAAVAIANLCCSRTINSATGEDTFISVTLNDCEIQKTLLEACIKHVEDHDKVASSAVRAVGLIAPIISSISTNDALLRALSENRSAKVRWSAANAIAHVLSSGALELDDVVIDALKDAMYTADSFKVRTAAVSALAAPKMYGAKCHRVGMVLGCAYEKLLRVSSSELSGPQLALRGKLETAMADAIAHVVDEWSGKEPSWLEVWRQRNPEYEEL